MRATDLVGKGLCKVLGTIAASASIAVPFFAGKSISYLPLSLLQSNTRFLTEPFSTLLGAGVTIGAIYSFSKDNGGILPFTFYQAGRLYGEGLLGLRDEEA